MFVYWLLYLSTRKCRKKKKKNNLLKIYVFLRITYSELRIIKKNCYIFRNNCDCWCAIFQKKKMSPNGILSIRWRRYFYFYHFRVRHWLAHRLCEYIFTYLLFWLFQPMAWKREIVYHCIGGCSRTIYEATIQHFSLIIFECENRFYYFCKKKSCAKNLKNKQNGSHKKNWVVIKPL